MVHRVTCREITQIDLFVTTSRSRAGGSSLLTGTSVELIGFFSSAHTTRQMRAKTVVNTQVPFQPLLLAMRGKTL